MSKRRLQTETQPGVVRFDFRSEDLTKRLDEYVRRLRTGNRGDRIEQEERHAI